MYEVLIDEVENIHFQYDVYDKGNWDLLEVLMMMFVVVV